MSLLVGTITKDESTLLGRALDDVIDFTKLYKGKSIIIKTIFRVAEMKDDDVFSALIDYLDDHYADRMPETYKVTVREIALSIIEEDIEKFKINSADLLNLLIDIPKVEEDVEALIIKGILSGLFEALELKYFA